MKKNPVLLFTLYIFFNIHHITAQDSDLFNSLIFYAPFDQTTDAEVGEGVLELHTAPAYDQFDQATSGLKSDDIQYATSQGLFGDGLQFLRKSKNVIFYPAKGNTSYNMESWSGAISFWLKLDPNEDLEPGYCDPIQLTDQAYNDAALWVDFSDKNPRVFRMGVFGDLDKWNPEGLKGDNPLFNNRLVPIENPPFSSDIWTHVVISFKELNTSKGSATLYLNGKSQGKADIPEQFTWDLDEARIIMGVNYVGMFDELAIFDKFLNDSAVQKLYKLKNGLTELID